MGMLWYHTNSNRLISDVKKGKNIVQIKQHWPFICRRVNRSGDECSTVYIYIFNVATKAETILSAVYNRLKRFQNLFRDKSHHLGFNKAVDF